MPRKKRFAIITLFLTTFVVAVTAIYVGIKLSEQPDLTPTDISALENLPLCFSDNFQDDGDPDPAKWLSDISASGSATVAGGQVILFAPSSTQTTERYSRLISIPNFNDDFIAEVDLNTLTRSTAGLADPENGIAKISFPYNKSSETDLAHYQVSANLVGNATDLNLQITGKIYQTEQQVVIPAAELDLPWARLRIEREIIDANNDLVNILYDTGDGYQNLMSATVQHYSPEGAVSISALTTDEFDMRAVFDNFAVSCLAVSSTSVPSITVTTSPTVQVTSGTTPTPQVTALVTPSPAITNTPTATIQPTATILPTSAGSVITVTPIPSLDITPKGENLPDTALVNDEVDRVILATFLITVGFGLILYVRTAKKAY